MTCFGCSYSRLENKFLDYGLRGVLPLAAGRFQLSLGIGGGCIWFDPGSGNVLVTKSGVKLLDFGLAKTAEPASSEEEETRTAQPRTEEGTIVGTAAYMSPEQAEGKSVDARSDVFSFAAVLYEMVTGPGAVPFAAGSPTSPGAPL